jgi:tetratricopeptide (TPR) repeat protein
MTAMTRLLALLVLSLAFNAAPAADTPPKEFETALDLIQAYAGSGDELQRAVKIAKDLSVSHPDGGYAETLMAEALSTWELDQNGLPPELFTYILKLCEEALRKNPGLAQAHIPRARALLRARAYPLADKAIDSALELDPKAFGAYVLRGEIYRRTNRPAEAEEWYQKFVDAAPTATRKSNGYYWMGTAWQEAAYREPAKRGEYIQKALAAHEKSVELHPNGAWAVVNFAIFLNNDVGDFDRAEEYAQKALGIMEFPMARFHLAIARYQKVYSNMDAMSDAAFRDALGGVLETTGVSLADAGNFADGRYAWIPPRMKKLQERAASGQQP